MVARQIGRSIFSLNLGGELGTSSQDIEIPTKEECKAQVTTCTSRKWQAAQAQVMFEGFLSLFQRNDAPKAETGSRHPPLRFQTIGKPNPPPAQSAPFLVGTSFCYFGLNAGWTPDKRLHYWKIASADRRLLRALAVVRGLTVT